VPPATDHAILHFTDVTNVPKIIAAGGIYPDNVMSAKPGAFTECASVEIKDARRTKPVPVPPFGYVGDYVPFYYAPRSPMMSAISYGQVPGYKNSRQLVYLISSVALVEAAGLRWVCTDGNARTGTTDFFNTRQALESEIDWPLMEERIWRNTTEDGDRKRRRAAEFLVHQFFPISLVTTVVTYNQDVLDSIQGSIPASVQTIADRGYYI
jgi:hypothetical protein